MSNYILISESALDLLLVQKLFSDDGFPTTTNDKGLYSKKLSDSVTAFATTSEPATPYTALISVAAITQLTSEGGFFYFIELYGRIARTVKALSNPPIHLPRSWSEFHHKNQLTFFALPVENGAFRWVADIEGPHRCVRFERLTSGESQCNLQGNVPPEWPDIWIPFQEWINILQKASPLTEVHKGFVEEVDLKVIGSGSVVQDKTYEVWVPRLSEEQKRVLDQPLSHSVRIIGPAGSGKTLTLCLRAIRTARDELTTAQAKSLLIVTHSWAMAERIDGILISLNGGTIPNSITVLPLLYVLQTHGAQIGQQATTVIGDDSKSGRVATIELIQQILPEPGTTHAEEMTRGVSEWISSAINNPSGGHHRNELVLNLYEEFTGVLAAGGVSIDNDLSLQKYLNDEREDWMPPFPLLADRRFSLEVYRKFLRLLSDRGAITTDQLVLDSIRVLETFSWRMRRESEGFDFIFVDELQLFDSQERLAIELLGRSGSGIPFTTAEDPSQGVFSALNVRRATIGLDQSVYLDCIHRFEVKVFEFIKFVYQKFPLNTIPLRIDHRPSAAYNAPSAILMMSDEQAIDWATHRAQELISNMRGDDRLCIATLGDTEDTIYGKLEQLKLAVVRLRGFDDVEQLSYRKKSIVIAPWQYIGGTQFSHVVVLVAGTSAPTTTFARLRELTAIYLACSRAMASLDIVCGVYVPQIVREAIDAGLVTEQQP